MPVEQCGRAIQRRNVLVGVPMDGRNKELLSWALVKVAEPEDCIVAVHVCRCSRRAEKDKPLLDRLLEAFDELCSLKKVELTGKISTGNSVRKTLVREAKNYAAVSVVVGISNHIAFGGWASVAKYCAKRLPPLTDVLAIHNGKIVYRRFNKNQLPGLCGDPKPSVTLLSPFPREIHSEYGDSETETECSSFECSSSCKALSPFYEPRKRSSSPFTVDILDQRPGWPFLRRVTLTDTQTPHGRELSVVQWAMNLPNRSILQNCRNSVSGSETSCISEERSSKNSSTMDELEKDLEIMLKTSSSSCKWFTYEVLKAATSKFSAGNLIGKGGCNRVYKGILADGKQVAVKIQKLSDESRKDFAREVDIMSSLNHKHITPLLGVCVKDTDLISVYDFCSKGSLEENLHSKNKRKSPLSWEVRFNMAVKIGEALNYLHNGCSRPVIHRDVKSSNILLSDSFKPQLSDFGLAIWGPTTSSFMTESDVVGTFGYLAPEYFMYGKVSDKIDVYSFGVVLLELLSGRKPIESEAPKGQESLVIWAKPIIEGGNVKGILDPALDANFDEVQMQRMVFVATLCLTRSARLRPKMSEVLKLLRGDNDVEKWVNLQSKDQEDQDVNDDEIYPNCSAELHLSLALFDGEDNSMSFSSLEQGNNLSMEEYLKGRWSRSSSFN